MPLDEHDARYFMQKHGKKLLIAGIIIGFLIFILVVLGMILPLLSPQGGEEIEYDDAGHPSIEREL